MLPDDEITELLIRVANAMQPLPRNTETDEMRLRFIDFLEVLAKHQRIRRVEIHC